MSSGEYVRSLFVTLRRGMAGKPWFHRRIIEALGLKERHHCVEKPNHAMIRGMLSKIPHLVIVETDRMFYLRRMRDYHEQLAREPWVAHHGAAVAAHLQLQAKLPSSLPNPHQLHQMSSTSTAVTHGIHSTSSAVSRRTIAEAIQLHPLQPVSLRPHLEEHLTPVPEQEASQAQKIMQPLKKRITALIQKRSRLVVAKGLYHRDVQAINQQIKEVRQQQVEQEEQHRNEVLAKQHTPGVHHARVRAAGRGSRRGMLAQARSKAEQQMQVWQQATQEALQQQQQQQQRQSLLR